MMRRIAPLVVMLALARAGFAEEPVLQITPGGPAGVCGVDQWKRDWPGCAYEDGVKDGRFSVASTAKGPAFRVDYALGEIGPAKGGVGWRMPIRKADRAELAYTVGFSEGFDWVKGGKLPGLSGGPESVTGGNPADGRNGFSARLMWRADGRGEAYVYHMHQPGRYGESFPFPPDFRFPDSGEVRVRLRVGLNTPGRRDGTLDVWVRPVDSDAEAHVLSRSDMEWRSGPDLAIDSLLFQAFHGGSDASWAPRLPSATTFRDIAVAWPRLGD
jgi:hypothetical protein